MVVGQGNTKAPWQMTPEEFDKANITAFQTGQGSTYLYRAGQSIRNKSAHQLHQTTDVGLKRGSEVTYFVSPQDAQKVGLWQGSSASGKRLIVIGDQAILTSLNPKTGQRGKDDVIRLTMQPKIGMNPLELNDRSSQEQPGQQWWKATHPGSSITTLGKATQQHYQMFVQAAQKKGAGTKLSLEGKKVDERFGKLLAMAMEETDSLEEATVAAALAYEMPAREPPPKPTPVNGYFAFDIHDPRAQGILNRAMAAAKKLSAQARRDIKAALAIDDPSQALHAVVAFLEKYRVALANLLGRTQLAAILEGAREVANQIPAIPPPGMDYPPPTLGPVAAVELVERLRQMEGMAREEEIYRLPPAEQRYVRQAMAVAEAPPPPIRLPAPPSGPEEIHWPVIEEAARLLSEKNVVTRDVFDRLDAAARQKAFTIAGIDSREAITKFRDLLSSQVAEGPDYAAFRKEALATVDEAGFLTDPHLEVVFRNATQTAFSDGQLTVLAHPFVRGGFPYTTYDAIHDDRVRENHLALEQLGIQATNVYRMDDPVFQRFRPPWDYNDRCGWTPLTVQQAAERGIDEAKTWLASGVEPVQKAWVNPPPFAPPPGFERSLEGMPLSIQLSVVSASDMLQAAGSEEEGGDDYRTGLPSFEKPEKPKWQKPKEKPRRSRTRKRRIGKRSRMPDEWRVLSGGVVFSTEAPGAGWVSAGACKWVRGVMFGLDAEGRWHGPQPPGPGWVPVGEGPQHGKIWQQQGGQTPQAQQPSQDAAGQIKSLLDRIGPDLTYSQIDQVVNSFRGMSEAEIVDAAAKNGMTLTGRGKGQRLQELRRRIRDRQGSYERVQFRPDAPAQPTEPPEQKEQRVAAGTATNPIIESAAGSAGIEQEASLHKQIGESLVGLSVEQLTQLQQMIAKLKGSP